MSRIVAAVVEQVGQQINCFIIVVVKTSCEA